MTFAVSRLAAGDIRSDLGVDLSDAIEIPCVRGLPVPIPIATGITVVREWPNLAGRCEPFESGDLVRWDPEMAPSPASDRIVARSGVPAGTGHDWAESLRWFRKFIRSLEQNVGVIAATEFDTARCILITPWSANSTSRANLPYGLTLVSPRLSEFPGGVVVTLTSNRWEQRDEYASGIRDWFTSQNPHPAEKERQA